MSRVIHAFSASTDPRCNRLAKVITLDEPGAPGITVRYTDLGSAVLMAAFIFRGRTRYGLRVLPDAERDAYVAERAAIDAGAGI